MISVGSQIQAILDSFGIHLDDDSFNNLLRALHIDRLSWALRVALGVALGVLAQYLKKQAEERRQAVAEAALAQHDQARVS